MARDPRYSTAEWRTVRDAAIIRDGQRCQMRLSGCQKYAPLRGGHANHIVSPLDGGPFFDLNNLEAACVHCNCAAGARYRNHRRAGTNYVPSRDW